MKKIKSFFKKTLTKAIDNFLIAMTKPSTQKVVMVLAMIIFGVVDILAQANAGIATAASTIKQYESQVKSLMNAIAAIIVIVGVFNVFYKMQNGDQDVKKTIMLTIGGCVAFVALGNALPLFFDS